MLARLETAVAQIKRFTADASHELRSPLSYIFMVSECALRQPNLPVDCREWFEDILAESQDATHLLEDMLVLARADAGHVDIRFEATDLVPLVQDAFERARVPAEAKAHHLMLQCVDGPFEIRGDRASLRRLIWTLLDNAIKYTPEGGRGAPAAASVRAFLSGRSGAQPDRDGFGTGHREMDCRRSPGRARGGKRTGCRIGIHGCVSRAILRFS
jgi:K+-sensing histidine kinase KdpD